MVAEIFFIAMLLVTKVVSSSAAERVFKMLGLIVTKPRNALEKSRIEDLLIVRMGMGAEEAKRRLDRGEAAFPPLRNRSTLQFFREDLAERAASVHADAEMRAANDTFYEYLLTLEPNASDPDPVPTATEDALGQVGPPRITEVDARDWEQFSSDVFGEAAPPDPELLALLNEVAEGTPLAPAEALEAADAETAASEASE